MGNNRFGSVKTLYTDWNEFDDRHFSVVTLAMCIWYAVIAAFSLITGHKELLQYELRIFVAITLASLSCIILQIVTDKQNVIKDNWNRKTTWVVIAVFVICNVLVSLFVRKDAFEMLLLPLLAIYNIYVFMYCCLLVRYFIIDNASDCIKLIGSLVCYGLSHCVLVVGWKFEVFPSYDLECITCSQPFVAVAVVLVIYYVLMAVKKAIQSHKKD